jgi:hypothetical protein
VVGKSFDLPCNFDTLVDGSINVADVIYLANLILEGPADPPLEGEVTPPVCIVTSNTDIELSCNFDFDTSDNDSEINVKDIQAMVTAILFECYSLPAIESPNWPGCAE